MTAADVRLQGWLVYAQRLVASMNVPESPAFAEQVVRDLLEGTGAAHTDEILRLSASWERVAEWRRRFEGGDADLFRFFAYRPGDVLTRFAPKISERRRWSTLVEIYEAWSVLAKADTPQSVIPFGWSVGSAYLARTRWMLLSLVFDAPPGQAIHHADLGRVDGPPGSGRIVALAQQAREDWVTVLAGVDDHPLLAARIGDLERELARVALLPLTGSRLDSADPSSSRADRAIDETVSRQVVGLLILPRFAWWTAARAAYRLAGLPARLACALAAVLMLTSPVLFAVAFRPGWTWAFTAAASSAVAGYAVIALSAALHRAAAWPWLLRQPAGAAIGLFGLAAFAPDWWQGGPGETTTAVLAAVGIGAVGIGYLVIEAANHGVRLPRLAYRPVGVGFLGLLHGFWVSLIGMRFLLPVFAEAPDAKPGEPDPLKIACWWAERGCQGQALPALALLALTTAWCFTVGVFLQIVWDDQPITVPLAHVSWRRGG